MAEQVGKYTLKRKIATGGMAEIWLAEQTGPGGFAKELVIKRILPHLANDAQFVEMFLDEARLAAQLQHPHIVQIYDLGEAGGYYYIAMEYIQGHDLEVILNASLEQGSGLQPTAAARIVADACAALDYAHTFADSSGRPVNLVHRDATPQNILISKNGQVKLVDFGVAKAATSSHQTQAGAVKGKFAYMSPEQVRGQPLDGRSDLFTLGIVLYELLTGRRPFGHDSELLAVTAILNNPPDPIESFRKDVPNDLKKIVYKALEKDANSRFSSAETMQTALEEMIQGSGSLMRAKELAKYVFGLLGNTPAIGETSPGAYMPASAVAAGSGGPPPPGPAISAPSGRSVPQPIGEQRVLVSPDATADTKKFEPGPTTEHIQGSSGIGAGLMVALVAVFLALCGVGYFIYDSLTSETGVAEGTGDGTGSTTDPVAHLDDEEDVESTSAVDLGQVSVSTPDAGSAVEPDGETPDVAVTVAPDAGGTTAASDVGTVAVADTSVASTPDVEPVTPDVGVVAVVDVGQITTAPDLGTVIATPDLGTSQPADMAVATVDIATTPPVDVGHVPLVVDVGTPHTPEVTIPQLPDVIVAPQLPDAGVPQLPDVVVIPQLPDVGGTHAVVPDDEEDDEEDDEDDDEDDEDGEGYISVSVSPPGRYEISIDGDVVGRTPLSRQTVEAGTHTIEVRRLTDDETERETVRVRDGREEHVRISF